MLSAGTRGPRWRALLEARWQARLEEVTELSLAYHGAAAAGPDGHGDGDGDGDGRQETQRLLRRTVAARRKLADVDEALGRLAAGNFGYCEDCGSAIPAGLLAVIPETRYCPRCDTEPAPAPSSQAAGARDLADGGRAAHRQLPPGVRPLTSPGHAAATGCSDDSSRRVCAT